MDSKNQTGKVFVIIVCAWLVFKIIFNAILGGFGIFNAVLSAAACIVLIAGINYANYVVAAFMALTVCINLPGNLKGILNLDSVLTSIIYLAEGAADICLAIGLCVSQSVKDYFVNTLSSDKKSDAASDTSDKS